MEMVFLMIEDQRYHIFLFPRKSSWLIHSFKTLKFILFFFPRCGKKNTTCFVSFLRKVKICSLAGFCTMYACLKRFESELFGADVPCLSSYSGGLAARARTSKYQQHCLVTQTNPRIQQRQDRLGWEDYLKLILGRVLGKEELDQCSHVPQASYIYICPGL